MASDDYSRRMELASKLDRTCAPTSEATDEGFPAQSPRTPRTEFSIDRESSFGGNWNAELDKKFQVWMLRLEGQVNAWHSKHQQWLQCELPFVLSAVPQTQSRERPCVRPVGDFSKNEDEVNVGLSPRWRTDIESAHVGIGLDVEKAASTSRTPSLAKRLMDLNNTLASRTHTIFELMKDGHCEFIVHHHYFGCLVSTVIVINAIVLCMQVELDCRGSDIDENGLFFVLAELSFALFFFVECILRFATLGKRFVLHSWNLFDVLLVFLHFIDFIVILANADELEARQESLRTTLIFFRVVRVVRLLRFIRPLRDIVVTISSSLMSMRWLFFATFMFTYIASTIVTAGVSEHLRSDRSMPENEMLEWYFGNLPATVYTLLLSTTSGISWKLCVDALWKVKPHLGVVFSVFILAALFLLFNVCTGIVVDNVIQDTSAERDFQMTQKRLATENVCLKLLEVLQTHSEAAGRSGPSSTVSLHELLKIAEDADLSAILDILKLNSDSRKFMRLFGKDRDGEVCAQDFIDSCLHLKGGTRNADLHMMLIEIEFENKRLHRETRADFKSAMATLNHQLTAALTKKFPANICHSVNEFGEILDEMSNYISPYSPRGANCSHGIMHVPPDTHEFPWIRPASVQFLSTPRGGNGTPGRSPRSAR